jgi:hypothetical protein
VNEEIVKRLSDAAKSRIPEGLLVEEWISQYNEALVELVVQECCELIIKNQYNMVPGFMERLSAYSEVCMLKKHFGVEDD